MLEFLGIGTSHAWNVFPDNGLDRSLHAPILIGLLFLTFFRETFGWSYAGLVVPGYLAVVALSAPVTGALIVGEAILAYWLAYAVGRLLPRLGLWSPLFGRERFLLIILASLVVRLALEGYWISWLVNRYGLTHSRELHSIGLVLVALLANAFWNSGFVAVLPRLGLVVGATYLVVGQVLLAHTNFTLARFQVANESVSLAFLETPHAHIILALGAIMAARDNVRYGWDYNGILVPALLAVAWYSPTKLLTTVLEALLVLWLSKLVTQYGPLARVLMVGSRRMLVAYSVGFFTKWVVGFAMMRLLPGVQLLDFFGFGYLLPSLLAIKMWNTGRIPTVIMPTLQVSLGAFIAGNALAYSLHLAENALASAQPGSTIETSRSVAWDLLRADSAPEPRPQALRVFERSPAQQVLQVIEAIPGASADLGDIEWEPSIRVAKTPDKWWVLGPRSLDPDNDWVCPRVALSFDSKQNWLVVAETSEAASANIVVASELAKRISARAVVVRSTQPALAPFDDAFIDELSQRLNIELVIIVRQSAGPARLELSGKLPEGLDAAWMRRTVGGQLALTWRAPSVGKSPTDNAPILLIDRATAETTAAALLSAPEPELWGPSLREVLDVKMPALTSVLPGHHRNPTIEELRIFSKGVGRTFLRFARGEAAPTAYSRAIAAELGLRTAKVSDPTGDMWALFSPPGEEREGHATWIVRGPGKVEDRGRRPVLLEVPSPLWERGTLSAALSFSRALGSQSMLLSGSFPTATPDGSADVRSVFGKRSYFQHIHELWIQQQGLVLSVQGIAPSRIANADVIVTLPQDLSDFGRAPSWAHPLLQLLKGSGLEVAPVDGSLERAPFEATAQPTMAYARRFGDQQMLIAWLTAETRLRFVAADEQDALTQARLLRMGKPVAALSVAERARFLAVCKAGVSGCPSLGSECSLDTQALAIGSYVRERNPYWLRSVLSAERGCFAEVAQDAAGGTLFALLANAKEVRLVPLRTGSLMTLGRPLRDPPNLEQAVALGLSAIAIGAVR